jgi:hypothetical protein
VHVRLGFTAKWPIAGGTTSASHEHVRFADVDETVTDIKTGFITSIAYTD